jgi:6-phosphogluconolactonase/glucosamine-6-phosphate isomerase/deaminase
LGSQKWQYLERGLLKVNKQLKWQYIRKFFMDELTVSNTVSSSSASTLESVEETHPVTNFVGS